MKKGNSYLPGGKLFARMQLLCYNEYNDHSKEFDTHD